MVSESMTGVERDVDTDVHESPEALLEARYRQWVKAPVGQRNRDQSDHIFRQIEQLYGYLIRRIIKNSGSFNERSEDDIYQEVFVQLFSLSAFPETYDMNQLVCAVARNTSRMHFRQAAAQRRGGLTTFQFMETNDGDDSWDPIDFSLNVNPVIWEELTAHIGGMFSDDDLQLFVSRVQDHETFCALASRFRRNERTIRRIYERIRVAVYNFLYEEGTNMSLLGDSADEAGSITGDLRRNKPR